MKPTNMLDWLLKCWAENKGALSHDNALCPQCARELDSELLGADGKGVCPSCNCQFMWKSWEFNNSLHFQTVEATPRIVNIGEAKRKDGK